MQSQSPEQRTRRCKMCSHATRGSRIEAALRETKRAHRQIAKRSHQVGSNGICVQAEDLKQWRLALATANKQIHALHKLLCHADERHAVERAIVNEELRAELVDREANAARVSDRFRAIAEQCRGEVSTNSNVDSTFDSTFDRASQAANRIESTISALCPHTLISVGQGTRMLMSGP